MSEPTLDDVLDEADARMRAGLDEGEWIEVSRDGEEGICIGHGTVGEGASWLRLTPAQLRWLTKAITLVSWHHADRLRAGAGRDPLVEFDSGYQFGCE